MRTKTKAAVAIIASAVMTAIPLHSLQTSLYPKIQELKSQNLLFKQYQDDVEQSFKDMAAGREPYINFYSYTAQKDDTIIQIAARCAVTYDSIVSLNSIATSDEKIEGKTIILPTVDGLYINAKATTSVGILLQREYAADIENGRFMTLTIGDDTFYFWPRGRFSPSQRAFFLDNTMVLPLSQSVLTSPFGMRVSPISGKWKMHSGIDMAAPEGTPIFACKSGTVTYVGYDTTYGNRVMVKHDNGMTSLYAHMSSICVKKGQIVSAGEELGKVGTTGLSTGPHLHFEIHMNGQAQDPSVFF